MRVLTVVVACMVMVMVVERGIAEHGGGGDGGDAGSWRRRNGLQLRDNGYEGVVVKIDDRFPETWCSGVLLGLEVTLARASSVLYRATRRRAFFRSITVVVPAHWTTARCPRVFNGTAVPLTTPAFTVTRPHPVYGHAPWTLQVGGCGKPGRTIYLTPQYLSDRNFSETLGDPGRVLVQEWAKYRWGVFEEYGHPQDPLYPTFHRSPTQAHAPTGCSNVPVQGEATHCDDYREASCRFTAGTGTNDGVTSSLMYLHHLPHVTQFCDSTTHQSAPPTKQNALCNHRPAWDVITQHEDFADGRNPGGDATRDLTPSFNYVRPSHPRFVIVVEDTAVMNVQKRWEFLRKAVRKLLVYDIPTGSEVGVVLFDRTAHAKLPLTLTPASLDDRQPMATASLPRNPSTVAQSQKCIQCGLEEGVRMLEQKGESAAGGVLLLVTSGSPHGLAPYDIQQLGQVVRKGVRVVPIIYPLSARNPKPLPGVEILAQLSGTQSFAVLDEGIGSDSKVSMMVSLMDALYAALRIFISDAKDLPVVVHKKEFPGGISSISQGYFNIDESLGGEIRFALTYYDLGHVGNMVNLIDPNNRVLETLHLQEEDGDVNTIFVTVTNAMPGNWRYRVENRADSHQSLYMRVWATPRAPNTTSLSSTPDNAITLTAWTSNWNSPIDVADIKNPVVVYAKVWWGESPVVGARVEASLQRLGVNSTGSRYAPINFLLLDNGSGDADVTRNDGIYSRYLPPVEAPASRYTLSVTVTDDGGAAQIIVSSHPHMDPPRPYVNHIPYSGQVAVGGLGAQYTRAHAYDPAWPRCCGSVVPYNTGRPTGSLYRTTTVGLVDLKGGEHSLSHLPPSRIGDFRAEINPAVRQVTFYWTAPGDRRDHGSAMQYEVVFSRNAAATGQGSGETAPEWSPPSDFGTPSSHTVRWGRHDGVYYVAIRAISKTQVPGPWSNTAELFMPHPPTTTENIRGSTQGGAVSGSVSELGVTTPRPASLTTRSILTIVGVVCGILVVILIMAVYYLVVVSRRRRQQQEKQAIDVLEPATTTPAACDTDSETDSITKPPAPSEALAVGDAEVPSKRAMSPIQSWPASTLLAEHEKRRPQDLPDGVESGDMNLPQPDLGVPQYMPNVAPCPPHPFYYHTPNGHYIEDNLAMDTGSMVSTQPSEFMYKVDSNTNDYTHPPSSSIAPTPVSWEGGRRPGPTKVPPPTPPKPTLSAHLTLGGVASTPVGQERKRRNVTQV